MDMEMIELPESIAPIVEEYVSSLGDCGHNSGEIGAVIMDWIDDRHVMAPRSKILDDYSRDYRWRGEGGVSGYIWLALMALGYETPHEILELHIDKPSVYRKRQLKWEIDNAND